MPRGVSWLDKPPNIHPAAAMLAVDEDSRVWCVNSCCSKSLPIYRMGLTREPFRNRAFAAADCCAWCGRKGFDDKKPKRASFGGCVRLRKLYWRTAHQALVQAQETGWRSGGRFGLQRLARFRLLMCFRGRTYLWRFISLRVCRLFRSWLVSLVCLRGWVWTGQPGDSSTSSSITGVDLSKTERSVFALTCFRPSW